MMAQDSSDPTGVVGDTRADSALVRARHRKQNAALQLSLAQVGWDEIAEAVGYPTARAARVAVEQALEREWKEDPQTKERMRRMAGQQFSRMIRAIWKKAMDPEHPEQLAAQRELRTNIQAYSKLYGLDAPSEMIVHTPTREELEEWVTLATATKATVLEEDDIFDVEVIEEEQDALPAP